MAGPQSPQLPATLAVDRFVRLCQLGGKVPTRRLLLSSKALRLAIPNHAAGRVPLRVLLARSRVRSRVRAPQAEGSPPLSALLPRLRVESREQAPRAGGRAPFRLLPCRSSTVKSSRQPSSAGSVPSCHQAGAGKRVWVCFVLKVFPRLGSSPASTTSKALGLPAPCAHHPRHSLAPPSPTSMFMLRSRNVSRSRRPRSLGMEPRRPCPLAASTVRALALPSSGGSVPSTPPCNRISDILPRVHCMPSHVEAHSVAQALDWEQG